MSGQPRLRVSEFVRVSGKFAFAFLMAPACAMYVAWRGVEAVVNRRDTLVGGMLYGMRNKI